MNKMYFFVLLLTGAVFADDLTSTEQPESTPAPSPVVSTSADVVDYTSSSEPVEKLYAIGFGAVYWMSGEMNIDAFYDVDATKDPSLVWKVFADYFVAPRFAVGAFMLTGTAEVDEYDFFFMELGFSLKPVIALSDVVWIKPGLYLGYRIAELGDSHNYKGLGINFGTEIVFKQGTYAPYIDIGFLSQSVGGNGDIGVVWAPIGYLGAGVQF